MSEPKIKFIEEGHIYIHEDTGKELISATEFIKQFFEKFNKAKWSNYVAERDNLTVREVLKKWEDKGNRAKNFGTYVHNYAESLIKRLPKPEATTDKHKKYFQAINLFMITEPYQFFDAEKIIGHPEYGIAGTVDAISKKDGQIHLIDWKTNQKIETQAYYDKKCLYPLGYLPDCNFTKYSLQLSLYRYILEKKYRWDVEGQKLVHLQDDGTYHKYEVKYLKKEVKAMLAYTGRL